MNTSLKDLFDSKKVDFTIKDIISSGFDYQYFFPDMKIVDSHFTGSLTDYVSLKVLFSVKQHNSSISNEDLLVLYQDIQKTGDLSYVITDILRNSKSYKLSFSKDMKNGSTIFDWSKVFGYYFTEDEKTILKNLYNELNVGKGGIKVSINGKKDIKKLRDEFDSMNIQEKQSIIDSFIKFCEATAN